MMVNAELYVKDLPGQLVGSLEPISLVDGNIVGVVHDRETIVSNRITVSVTFTVGSAEDLEKLKAIWKKRDVVISRMGSVNETFAMEYMLIGEISASYIEELIDEASKIVQFDSIDVRYSSKTASSKRTAMILVKVRSEDDVDELDMFLAAACRKTGTVYVRGL
jgi:ACT domain-containing protein